MNATAASTGLAGELDWSRAMNVVSAFDYRVVMLSVFSVLKILGVASTGMILSWVGILDKRGRQILSKVTVNVTLPCLIFYAVGSTVSISNLIAWWPLAAFAVFNSIVATIFGVLGSFVMCIDTDMRPMMLFVTACGNHGGIPLVLMSSLCNAEPLMHDPGCANGGATAEAYVFIYTLISDAIMWQIYYPFVQCCKRRNDAIAETAPHPEASAAAGGGILSTLGVVPRDGGITKSPSQQAFLSNGQRTSSTTSLNGMAVSLSPPTSRAGSMTDLRMLQSSLSATSLDGLGISADGSGVESGGDFSGSELSGAEGGTDSFMFPIKMVRILSTLNEDGNEVTENNLERSEIELSALGDIEAGAEDADVERRTGGEEPAPAPTKNFNCADPNSRWCPCIPLKVSKSLQSVVSPPVLASLAGIFCGIVPPVQWALFSPASPVAPLTSTFNLLGQMTVPVMLMVLGAGLAELDKESKFPIRETLMTCFFRLLAGPVVALGSVFAAQELALLPPNNAAFRLVLLLEPCVPTAMSTMLVCSMIGFASGKIGKLLLVQYIASIITLSTAIIFFLALLTDVQ